MTLPSEFNPFTTEIGLPLKFKGKMALELGSPKNGQSQVALTQNAFRLNAICKPWLVDTFNISPKVVAAGLMSVIRVRNKAPFIPIRFR